MAISAEIFPTVIASHSGLQAPATRVFLQARRFPSVIIRLPPRRDRGCSNRDKTLCLFRQLRSQQKAPGFRASQISAAFAGNRPAIHKNVVDYSLFVEKPTC